MALSAATVWEVRPGGSDTNGGGFKRGASGTDWTQQDAAQYSVTDGVTAGTTTITSATANFGTDVVGNIIYVQGGTGSITAGWYEITVRNSSTSITVDRSTGLTAGTGVTLKIGGAHKTIATPLAVKVDQNHIWVKGGSNYTITTGLTISSTATLPNSAPILVSGYTTTRGDSGTATVDTATNNLTLVTISGNNIIFSNFILDSGGTTTSIGLKMTTNSSERGNRIINVTAKNFTTAGFQFDNTSPIVIRCLATGGTSAATAGFYVKAGDFGLFIACEAYANACDGFANGAPNVTACRFDRCYSYNNTNGGDGWYWKDALGGVTWTNCVAYGNAGIGINLTDSPYVAIVAINNIIVNNTGVGFTLPISHPTALPIFDYNAYYGNSSPRTNSIAGANDVTLTGSPFTDGANGDFSLNNTSGQGAAVRALGFPATSPRGATANYLDIGATQHADPAGGAGGLLTHGGMTGGARG